MMKIKVTSKQLSCLLALYSRSVRGSASEGDPRTARLAWASQTVGRDLASFRDLRCDEAAALIDSLKKELGQPITPPPARRPRKRKEYVAVTTMATAEDLRRVHFWRMQLGYSPEQFDSWLNSKHSPTRGRKLLTVANCRAVTTALRSMRRRAVTMKRAG